MNDINQADIPEGFTFGANSSSPLSIRCPSAVRTMPPMGDYIDGGPAWYAGGVQISEVENPSVSAHTAVRSGAGFKTVMSTIAADTPTEPGTGYHERPGDLPSLRFVMRRVYTIAGKPLNATVTADVTDISSYPQVPENTFIALDLKINTRPLETNGPARQVVADLIKAEGQRILAELGNLGRDALGH